MWWKILAMVSISVLMAVVELPSLLKKNQKKEIVIFWTLLGTGTAISIAMILHVQIPNPADGIMILYRPVSDWIDKIL
ncbi:hypothetical protein ACFQ88_00020 [Paenibacillus sp. NPDC056579]|uniref:hypothetical protein n=1 Tax=Paenibacillus sp. NPDC056579 TaxID=3345871 RepID=UPI00368EB50D